MRRSALLLGFVLGGFGATACGRHATEKDCDIILDRMVVVKLKQRNITDPPSIAKMQSDLRKDAQSDFPGCVGRRISDGAMECIQKADTQEAIVKCLR
jgi:chorismate mutase